MKIRYLATAQALATALTALLGPQSANAEERSAASVANELANPNTALGSFAFPIDYIAYQGDLPGSGSQEAWKISAQPSLPYPIGKNMNLFFRPLIPIILEQPVFDGTAFSSSDVELGDIGFDAAIGMGFANGIQIIGGISGSLDTATDKDVGLGQTLLGPEFFIGRKTDWGFYGILASHQWDIAGDDDFNTSITGGQYFFTYNLKNAWQIQMQPTWSYNHEADSGDKWTLPLGIGVAKVLLIGKTPWKFSLQYWHYVASPDSFGQNFQVRFQIAPVIRLPW